MSCLLIVLVSIYKVVSISHRVENVPRICGEIIKALPELRKSQPVISWEAFYEMVQSVARSQLHASAGYKAVKEDHMELIAGWVT